MKSARIDKIESKRFKKYSELTEKALDIAKRNVSSKKLKDAKEILLMAKCYIEDAKYFQKKGDYVNAFACINYAHGWLDAGSKLGIFEVSDTNLFVIR